MSTSQKTATASISISVDEGVDCGSLAPSPTSMTPRPPSASSLSRMPVRNQTRERKWDENYWYRGAKIAWHQRDPSSHLLSHYQRLLGENSGKTARVLLPLIGKSVDLIWLWQRGHEVVGVENIDATITAFAKSSGLDFSSDLNNNSQSIREFMTAEKILNVLQTNFMTGNNAFQDHSFSAVWDRSAFASIPPHFRPFYVETMKRLLDPHRFCYILVACEYDDTSVTGPPFSLRQKELSDLFTDFALISRIDERVLSSTSRTYVPNKFTQSAIEVREVVYLLRNV